MAFDADAYLAALEPPTYMVGGRLHQGRLLSFDEWTAWFPRMKALMERKLSFEQTRQFLRDLTNAFFSPPAPKGWRRLFHRAKDHPVTVSLLGLPLQAQMDAVRDFMRLQAKGLGLEPGTPYDPPAPAVP
jgi:hypothetical protein